MRHAGGGHDLTRRRRGVPSSLPVVTWRGVLVVVVVRSGLWPERRFIPSFGLCARAVVVAVCCRSVHM